MAGFTTALVQNPNSARLIDWGHSWVAPPNQPYNVSDIISGGSALPADGEQWPFGLRDALGIGSSGSYYKTYAVNPAGLGAAVDATILLDQMPADGTIEAVWYVPNQSVIGLGSGNARLLSLNLGRGAINTATNGLASTTVFAMLCIAAGITNMVAGQGAPIYSVNYGVEPTTSFFAAGLQTPYVPAVRYPTNTAASQQDLYWVSAHSGTGQIDPGGTVVIRFGTRYRNYGVGGTTLIANPSIGNVGGWRTCFTASPWCRPNAAYVNATSALAIGPGPLAVTAIQYALSSGMTINFPGGGIFTLTASAFAGATSLTGNLTGAAVVAHTQGSVSDSTIGLLGGYDVLNPSGINVWTHGLNDTAYTQDNSAWGECVRASIARNLCAHMDYPNNATVTEGNVVQTNGGGGGAWSQQLPYPNGSIPILATNNVPTGTPLAKFTGVATAASIAFSVGPSFEGGVLDLFLLAPAGTSVGYNGPVTVDGAQPPQGAVNVNTSAVSTSGLCTYSTGTCTAAASVTVTTTTQWPQTVIGDLFTAAAGTVPAGTVISAVGVNTLTLSAAVTLAGVVGTARKWVPMVKRLTGLTAGAHTVTLTLNGADSTAGASQSCLLLVGLGRETIAPLTPVLWCNITRCPGEGSSVIALAYNAVSQAVIAGTASPATPASGTPANVEPALPASVIYCDIDTLLGGSTSNANFGPDGFHLNSRGDRLMTDYLFAVMEGSLSPPQLISR